VSEVSTRRNRQIVLARRPIGAVTEDCFAVAESDVPALGAGEALLEVRYLGIDPTIRGWLDERGNYMPGVAIGECVRSNGVGVVVETNNPQEYPLGRAFMSLTGWQQYCVVQPNPFPPITLISEAVQLTDVLGVLGHIGITAYIGVLEVAKPQPGETFLVSAAASSVGSVAGQIAKMQGARVIGIAGSAAKCAWVVDELGFDACIDYKAHADPKALYGALKAATPNGIDGHFENVGGPAFDAVLLRMNEHGRIALCGMISGYNGEPIPLRYPSILLTSRLMLQGFIVSEHMEHWPAALTELGTMVATGKLKYRETIAEGLDAAPEAFIGMLNGKNFGKQLVKLS
jgi:NADPH-dependent curcumin reductase